VSPDQIALLVEQSADGPTLLTVLATALSVTLAVGAIIGGFVKWVVLPNLRDMVRQQTEIHKQVTENHHSNDKPTLLDKLDDIERAVDRVDTKVDKVDEKVDAHLITAAAIDATVAARVKALEKRADKGGL
jgi:hypothetical protein